MATSNSTLTPPPKQSTTKLNTVVPTLRFGDALGFDMVVIHVGPSRKKYHVHKKILCDKVDYFHKMFNNGFTETLDQAATLLEVNSDTFDLFLEWVYGGDFQPLDMTKNTPYSGPIVDLIRLYGFAESICLSELQDLVATSVIVLFRDNSPHHGLSLEGMALIVCILPIAPSSKLFGGAKGDVNFSTAPV